MTENLIKTPVGKRSSFFSILIGCYFITNGCLYYDRQIKLSFDTKSNVVLDINRNPILRLEITKLGDDSNYVCSSSYMKLPNSKGMSEITLNSDNKGYIRYDTSCITEKGFVYKIKGYSLHSIDTIIIKL